MSTAFTPLDGVASGPFDQARRQLLDAAAAFAGGPGALGELLAGLVDDVDRSLREELEIFPVCHHSPASASAMVRRLREKRPSAIYLELCEDLRPSLDQLRKCRLPVALQAFAAAPGGALAGSGPFSVVAPITEASAEYQAIAYALDTPGVELVAVDHSADRSFHTMHDEPAGADSDLALHGDAVGVELGDLRPRLAELEAHLLHHGRVRHWSEWWDQYVEQPLAGADHDAYRQVMTLIGSLFRRLTPAGARLDVDEERERHMWARIHAHLAESGVDPSRCLYVCGAFHAVSRVEQFGLAGARTYQPTPSSATIWQYGLIPSSHSAIEAQFGLARGSVSIATATWAKAMARGRARPFRLKGQPGSGRGAARPATPDRPVVDRLAGFLTSPPALDGLDEAELLGWCVDIVRLARRHGYLSGTADAIAVFETSILLAGLRNRARPTPYDFQDAAVTCIEKEVVPGRRDVRRLCEILLGGDRVGQVGYDALPPLARDVYDRLAPLELDPARRTIQRVLLDLEERPELTACSDLLWKLRYLLPDDAVRPIMGQRRLGERSARESWDLAIGRHQRSIIELAYEGVTVEQVLQQRLRKAVQSPQATAAVALAAVEDCLIFLGSDSVAEQLGARAVELLAAERSADDAPAVLRRIRRLLAHYRTADYRTGSAAGARPLPSWCEAFAVTGHTQYCTLLPTAAIDEDAGVCQVAAMLGFLFAMESLVMSLGHDRAQLELAVRQARPQEPAKVALLWAARYHLGLLPLPELRSRCAQLLDNPLVVPAFPRYLSGFVQALEPVPTLAPFVVEIVSEAFGRLPDAVLLPALPKLITTLREHAGELMPVLVREAGRTFPADLAALDTWVPPWSPSAPAAAQPDLVAHDEVAALLARHPAAVQALAGLDSR